MPPEKGELPSHFRTKILFGDFHPFYRNHSRVARNKFCWGLGVRAVRAGSIGRDDPRLEENTASPKWGGAGGLGPRPLHEDPSVL